MTTLSSFTWDAEDFLKVREPISTDALSGHLSKAKECSLNNLIITQIYEAKTAYSVTGKGIKIAVFDTGVDNNHEQLETACHTGINRITDTADTFDEDGHGTMVAGIIAGKNFICPDAEIYPVKILSNEKNIDNTKVLNKSLDWCIQNGIDIVNISAGTSYYILVSKPVIDRAVRNGIIIVAAAGNKGSGAMFPASFSNVLSVGGMGCTDGKYGFYPYSNMWPTVDICAPAENIFSAYSNPSMSDYKYHIDTGTSLAAPHVTGTLALGLELLKRYSVKYSPREIMNIIKGSAKHIDDPEIYHLARGYDPDSFVFKKEKFINECAFGTGIVQAKTFLDSIIKKKKIKMS